MIDISVKSTLDQMIRKLEGTFSADQLPYAAARALTKTAQDSQGDLNNATKTIFSSPVPYTQKAFGVMPATKDKLTAFVFAYDHQSKYLKTEIWGGQRNTKAFEKKFGLKVQGGQIAVPGKSTPKDRYGNVTIETIQAITDGLNAKEKSKVFFVGTPKNNPKLPFLGIYARLGAGDSKRLVPVMLFVSAPTYKKNFDMLGLTRQAVKRVFAPNFRAALEEAMRTAR